MDLGGITAIRYGYPLPPRGKALRGAAATSTLSQEALIDGRNLVAQVGWVNCKW